MNAEIRNILNTLNENETLVLEETLSYYYENGTARFFNEDGNLEYFDCRHYSKNELYNFCPLKRGDIEEALESLITKLNDGMYMYIVDEDILIREELAKELAY